MKNRFSTLLFLLFFSVFPAFTQILDPVKWTFDKKDVGDNQFELSFIATIEPTWHLYSQFVPEGGPVRTSFNFSDMTGFEFTDPKVVMEEFDSWEEEGEKYFRVVFNEPKGKEEYDPNFEMVVKYFANKAAFTQKIRITVSDPLVITGYLEFMCCDDTKCLPPKSIDFAFAFNEAKITDVPQDQKSKTFPVTEIQPLQVAGDSTAQAIIEEQTVVEEISPALSVSFWDVIIEAILWGFIALLTPCVFPMIPMTITFFMKGGQNKRKGKIQASAYGISIVLLYTLPIAAIILITYVVGGKTVTADIFNWLSTHWIPNILFFLIFMFFAASFLGMFEIVLPSWMVNKADSKVDQGGLAGTFFMALTLVLVSFSCTGPLVGTVLVKSAQGEIFEPIFAMLAFSIAFALPFTLFAFFPSWLQQLPKSGGWLNAVKVVLGFIEIALGLKFLSVADQTYHWGILDREVYLAIWIVTFSLMGFYLLGKLKFAHDSDMKYIPVPRLGLAIIVFSFVVYLIPGMFGAPLKFLSGYLPPQHTHDFDLNAIVRDEIRAVSFSSGDDDKRTTLCDKPKYSDLLHLPHGLEGYFDLEQGMACARKLNKPVFIDFTGHGCVNCREMEANVWSDSRVLKRLREDYLIIALYVDDKTRLPEEDWVVSEYDGKVKKSIGKKYADLQISMFHMNAQPYYVLLDTEGKLLLKPRSYSLNVEAFVDFLDSGLEEFNRRSGR